MKPRRELKVGERVRVERLDGTTFIAIVAEQKESMVLIKNGNGADIAWHRRQCVPLKNKKQKRFKWRIKAISETGPSLCDHNYWFTEEEAVENYGYAFLVGPWAGPEEFDT